jgi:hypothetical protein
MRCGLTVLVLAASTAGALAQTPQPFPRPGDPARPQPSSPAPAKPDPQGPKVLPPDPSPAAAQSAAAEPTEQTLGLPLYPGARFIASYDAGRGQRYYIFGVNSDFAQIVAFYRTALKQKGELIFDAPAIHMFEVGRFREESMVFPPGVTVKDYSPEGYMSFKDKTPERFKTIIQVVPPPPAGTEK